MARPNVEAQRRKQILSAACEVIADVGLQAFRLADVAKRAGVSSGIIHYYFDTKREVVNAAFELNFERSLQSRRELLESSGDDPLDTLREIVVSYLPSTEPAIKAWRVWAELWSGGMRDESLQEINTRLYGQWRELVRNLIVEGQQAGQIIDVDSAVVADSLIAMIDGMSIQHLMHSPEMPLDLIEARMTQYLDYLAR